MSHAGTVETNVVDDTAPTDLASHSEEVTVESVVSHAGNLDFTQVDSEEVRAFEDRFKPWFHQEVNALTEKKEGNILHRLAENSMGWREGSLSSFLYWISSNYYQLLEVRESMYGLFPLQTAFKFDNAAFIEVVLSQKNLPNMAGVLVQETKGFNYLHLAIRKKSASVFQLAQLSVNEKQLWTQRGGDAHETPLHLAVKSVHDFFEEAQKAKASQDRESPGKLPSPQKVGEEADEIARKFSEFRECIREALSSEASSAYPSRLWVPVFKKWVKDIQERRQEAMERREYRATKGKENPRLGMNKIEGNATNTTAKTSSVLAHARAKTDKTVSLETFDSIAADRSARNSSFTLISEEIAPDEVAELLIRLIKDNQHATAGALQQMDLLTLCLHSGREALLKVNSHVIKDKATNEFRVVNRTPYQERIRSLREAFEVLLWSLTMFLNVGMQQRIDSALQHAITEDIVAHMIKYSCIRTFEREDITRCLYEPGHGKRFSHNRCKLIEEQLCTDWCRAYDRLRFVWSAHQIHIAVLS